MRANGALGHRGRDRDGERWVDFGLGLKVGLAGIADGLDVGRRRGEVKDASKVFGLRRCKEGAVLPEPGETGRRAEAHSWMC